MSLPLTGLGVRVGTGADPCAHATALLRSLGAQTSVVGGPELRIGSGGARLDAPLPEAEPGLPFGVLELATSSAMVTAAFAGFLAGEIVEVSTAAVCAQVYLPLVVASSYGATPPTVRPPRPVSGGFVDDATSGEDADTFDRLLVLDRDAGVEEVVSHAQEWRLPVAPYRRPHRVPPVAPISPAGSHDRRWSRVDGSRRGTAPLDGTRVLDFTAVWAGPLATWLLATLGAEVVKVEPAARLDGFRAVDGGGIYPDDHFEAGRLDRSGWFNALNRNKLRADLDARTRLDDLLAEAAVSDIVVESFSRRVMGNLGLSPTRLTEIRPGIVTISLPAFSRGGPQADWVAFGTGVHAACGLGWTPGGFTASAVAHPDPLAGFTAAATAVAALAAREAGWTPSPAEVSLELAVAPLTGRARRIPFADLHLGATLLDAAPTEIVTDGAGTHRYPRSPFTGSLLPALTRPAP